ncbi:hypothetical protein [Streptomyces sp. ISL-11]|uniref:hypothetical protein n=1 Tax=Streptomyces sp. ISL-11 TaxID=2819174 RepID=UPI001BE56962|nr:hypothetical protein [Streptomyces sp. ISL-11]MBT2383748.1 hypothetical protein [Streptomyces sp. ISL-11]
MKIAAVLRELHHSENALAHHLLLVSERHKADHEIHHLARDLATWSQRHVRALAEAAHRYDLELDPEPRGDTTPAERLREKGGELLGRRPTAGLLVLRDLRKIYTDASGVSVDWEMLAQAAQATKDEPLLRLTRECHPDTLRQMRWANAQLKETSPQILVS